MASSKNRKAAALALAVVGVAGLSIASAAQLNVETASLGAAQKVVESCQTGTTPIGIEFDVDFNGGSYAASGLLLTDVAATCAGLQGEVTLTDLDGDVLATAPIASVATGTNTIALTGVSAEAVTGVAVVIFG